MVPAIIFLVHNHMGNYSCSHIYPMYCLYSGILGHVDSTEHNVINLMDIDGVRTS